MRYHDKAMGKEANPYWCPILIFDTDTQSKAHIPKKIDENRNLWSFPGTNKAHQHPVIGFSPSNILEFEYLLHFSTLFRHMWAMAKSVYLSNASVISILFLFWLMNKNIKVRMKKNLIFEGAILSSISDFKFFDRIGVLQFGIASQLTLDQWLAWFKSVWSVF